MRDASQLRAKHCSAGAWGQVLRWLTGLRYPWSARPQRQLRLCETLPLGERRFLSLVELGEQRFLVGGTGSSLSLLAVLGHSSQPAKQRPWREREEEGRWEAVDGEFRRKPEPA
jgi:flagellar biogenesis protein FliO